MVEKFEGLEARKRSSRLCVEIYKGSCGELGTQIYIGLEISYFDSFVGK